MRRKRNALSVAVALLLLMTLNGSPVAAQSSAIVAIGKGEPAPADGIWLSREAYDEIVSEAEANQIRRSQIEAAQALLEEYRKRVIDLEASRSVQVWVTRACGVAAGVLGGLYAHQLGVNGRER